MKYFFPGIAAAVAALSALAAATPAGNLPAQAPNLATVTLNNRPCPPEGTATSDSGKALNRLKNRFAIPDDDDIDPHVSLPALMAPGFDRTRFHTNKAATIRAFVIRVSFGGIEHGETCNCGSRKPGEVDTHIDLGAVPNAPPKQRVIVEITHRLRLLMKAKNPPVDWSTKKIKERFEGKWVEVTGWLMFDTAHIVQAENTNPGHAGNFRVTGWELHPVTDIRLLAEPPTNAAAFQPDSFQALQQMHAADLDRAKNGRAALAKTLEDALKGFSAEERKEFEEEAKEREPKKP